MTFYLRFLPLLLSFLSLSSNAESYRIATGSENGVYKAFSQNLIKDLSTLENPQNFYLIESSGSVENISLLRSGVADLAILQQNIAAEAYFSGDNPYKGFEVLGPIYPEILQIVIFGRKNNNHTSLTITEVSKLLKLKKIDQVFIDGDGTASHLSIERLLALHGIGESIIPYTFTTNINEPKNCKSICLAISVDKFSNIFNEFNLENASYVQLSIQEYIDLNGKIAGFNLFQITQKNDKPFLALGTWAIVVSGHTLDSAIYNNLKDSIENYIAQVQNKLSSGTGTEISIVEILPSKEIRKIPSSDYIKTAVFSSLPLSRGLEKSLQNNLSLKAVLLYLLLIISLYFLCKKLFSLQYEQVWHRYQHFIYSAGFLVLVFTLFGKLIHLSEISLVAETGINSTLATYTLIDMYEWITIFAFTGYNGTAFPVSTLGQLISTFSHFIGIGTALFSVLAEVIFMKKQKKREAGEYIMNLSNHIVICGGNDQLHQLINNLEKAFNEYNEKLPKVVIIYPHFQQLLDKSPALKKSHELGKIEYIKGAVREESTLESACISSAKMIYLIAEDKTIKSDEKTLLRALSISRFCRKKKKLVSNEDIDSAYMVAEISNADFHDALINADVNEIVNTSNLSENLLIQSALNPGISEIISSLLAIDDGHEFYNIKISKYPELSNKNFDQLLIKLREKTILLIGIRVGILDHSGQEVIDANLVRTELKNIGLNRQVLTNPHEKNEIDYKSGCNDTLVVLAESKKTIERALKTYKSV